MGKKTLTTIDNQNKKLDSIMESIQQSTDDKSKTDAMALYYAYIKHPFESDLCRLTIFDAAEYLSISADRVRKARKLLIDLGIIEPRTVRNEGGIFHLVKLIK